jgi:lipopolysaccharide transport system ATP-binding protein
MKLAIKVEQLGKKYLIKHQGKERYATLRDVIADKTKKIFSFSGGTISEKTSSIAKKEEFWALKDVNFEVNRGDRIGIIGRNGAGKSTLLKILSRITEPTEGRIGIKGRIASLLEVGTGFHPELTGRENIYLNGAILGMHRVEIKRKFDEIVEFSGVEKFLDTPVKRYSSGMYVRLAFAVAAHLESEILIVDEVLAVGDFEFQKKCLGKMQDVANEQGRTVLFVSHNMGAINQLCNRAMMLTSGRISETGATLDVVRSYYRSGIVNGQITKNSFSGPLASVVHFTEVSINGLKDNICISPSSEIRILIKGICNKDLEFFRAGVTILNDGTKLFSMHEFPEPLPKKAGSFSSELIIPKYLLRPGTYSVSIFGHGDGKARKGSEWIYGVELMTFSISEEWDSFNDSHNEGIINVPTILS